MQQKEKFDDHDNNGFNKPSEDDYQSATLNEFLESDSFRNHKVVMYSSFYDEYIKFPTYYHAYQHFRVSFGFLSNKMKLKILKEISDTNNKKDLEEALTKYEDEIERNKGYWNEKLKDLEASLKEIIGILVNQSILSQHVELMNDVCKEDKNFQVKPDSIVDSTILKYISEIKEQAKNKEPLLALAGLPKINKTNQQFRSFIHHYNKFKDVEDKNLIGIIPGDSSVQENEYFQKIEQSAEMMNAAKYFQEAFQKMKYSKNAKLEELFYIKSYNSQERQICISLHQEKDNIPGFKPHYLHAFQKIIEKKIASVELLEKSVSQNTIDFTIKLKDNFSLKDLCSILEKNFVLRKKHYANYCLNSNKTSRLVRSIAFSFFVIFCSAFYMNFFSIVGLVALSCVALQFAEKSIAEFAAHNLNYKTINKMLKNPLLTIGKCLDIQNNQNLIDNANQDITLYKVKKNNEKQWRVGVFPKKLEKTL